MRRLLMQPDGWPCIYAECPPGFFVYETMLGFKSEYGGDGYCDSGEFFVGGGSKQDRDKLTVQPVVAVWVDEEV